MIKLEKDIFSNWVNKDKVVVSVSVITFNHEKYIDKTIKSILNQKTNFRFEILIHDDASDDKTQKIIKKYTDIYPNLIFPIYQKENQYQLFKKNIAPINPPLNYINFKRAKGEFIAMCDGDDYWEDDLKLEKQVNKMKEFPNINVSFHGLFINNHKKNIKFKKLISKKLKIYKTSKIIFFHHRLYTSTVTMMIRKRLIKDLPEFYKKVPTEDFYLLIFGSLRGGALYIPEVLSVYNLYIPNSWSTKKRNPYHYLYNVITLGKLMKFLNFRLIFPLTFVIIEFYLKYLILKIFNRF